jgi:PEP-CTERM motif
MTKTTKRIALTLILCTLLSPIVARANILSLGNQSGYVTLSDSGIISSRSELTAFRHDGRKAPPGHDLGSVTFSTGALLTGTISGGGTFSSAGSSYIATGFGKYGVPNGTIFSGSFVDPINWAFVGTSGKYDVFYLSGTVSGTLYNGRSESGTVVQDIYVLQNGRRQTRGRIHAGYGTFGISDGVPEPGTTLLFGAGLTVLVSSHRLARRGRQPDRRS